VTGTDVRALRFALKMAPVHAHLLAECVLCGCGVELREVRRESRDLQRTVFRGEELSYLSHNSIHCVHRTPIVGSDAHPTPGGR
jgi:hypothetical protein